MKCFYHNTKDAIGTCKHCCKGICEECAIDLDHGLACKDKCEDEVKALNLIVQKSKDAFSKTGQAAFSKTSQAYYSNAIIYGFLGSLFIIFGIVSKIRFLLYFLATAGIVFLLGSVLSIISGRKFNSMAKKEENDS